MRYLPLLLLAACGCPKADWTAPNGMRFTWDGVARQEGQARIAAPIILTHVNAICGAHARWEWPIDAYFGKMPVSCPGMIGEVAGCQPYPGTVIAGETPRISDSALAHEVAHAVWDVCGTGLHHGPEFYAWVDAVNAEIDAALKRGGM